jgi:hypothetical protein
MAVQSKKTEIRDRYLAANCREVPGEPQPCGGIVRFEEPWLAEYHGPQRSSARTNFVERTVGLCRANERTR